MTKNILIEECYKKSIELLLDNSNKFGIMASSVQETARKRDYLSVFSRDASISLLGMVASGNKKLILSAKRSLDTLCKGQASNGQIPNYVKNDGTSDFWRMGCIDATLWWLVAVKFYDKYSQDSVKLQKKYKLNIDKAITWLKCQEHVKDGLIEQNEASDWADLLPRSGKVLYSNSLWYKVKSLYDLGDLKETKENFNNLFFPFGANVDNVLKCDKTTVQEIRKNKTVNCYLSYVNYLFWGDDIDVYGNSLAIIFNLTPRKLQNKIVEYLLEHERNNKLPIPVLFNPIKKNSKNWRKYMESYNQNFPYQYHNGGIWPYASCFWVIALVKSGKKKEALEEFEKIAQINKQGNWRFSEWLQAKNGKLNGMRGQTWNAGMFVATYHFLKGKIEI